MTLSGNCVGWIHYTRPHTCTGKQIWADPTHLRGNHYYLRSLEEGLHKAFFLGQGKAELTGSTLVSRGSVEYIEAIYDGSILQWVPGLKRRIHELIGGASLMPQKFDLDHLGIKADNMERPGDTVENNRYRLRERIRNRLKDTNKKTTLT